VQTSQGPMPTMVRLEGEALLRLLEVRRTLETDVARKAARLASPAQKAEIHRLCEVLLAVVATGQGYHDADHAFHGAVADASGNPMYGQMLTRLDEAFERSHSSPFSRAAFGLRSFPIHRTLADAIIAGDAEAAAQAVDAIVDTVDEEIRQIIGIGRS